MARPEFAGSLGRTRRQETVDRILMAVCGYARAEGKHYCKAGGRWWAETGCAEVDWRLMRGQVEAEIDALIAELVDGRIADSVRKMLERAGGGDVDA